MLSPLLRVHTEQGFINQVMPHYMFYAPYLDDNDIGGSWVSGSNQPFMVNSGTALDKSHSIFNFIIVPAGEDEKAKIMEEDKDLLRRLAEYKPLLKIEKDNADNMHHH